MTGGGLGSGGGGAVFRSPVPDVPLVVVTAHHGAGKTRLLRLWYEQESAGSDRDAVWFEVDTADDDPVHLLARLEPLVGSATRPLIVFLDNFDVVGSQESRRAVVELVEHAPRSARLVVAQDLAKQLPVARLRADSLVAEIGDAELQLREDDLDDLLAGRNLSLSALGRARLLAATEGWAKGIAAVLDRLEAAPDEPEGELISRGLEELEDQMVAIIEASVDQHDFQFLVDTSILEELEPGLCDAIVGAVDPVDLDRVAAARPFVNRVDGRAGGFRLHGLARRGLQAALAGRESPDDIAARHVAAANWLESTGNLVAALHHSLAAGMAERAADLLAVLWSADPSAVGQTELDSVGQALAGDYVPHIVTTALLREQAGDRAGLQKEIDRLADAEWVGPLPHGFGTLDSALVSLTGSLAQPRGEAELSRIVEIVTRDESSTSGTRRLIGQSAAASALYLLGRFDEAWRQAEVVLLGHRSVGRHTTADRIATVRASDLCALLAHDLGNIAEARRHLRHTDELVATYEPPAPGDAAHPVAIDRALVKVVVGDQTVGARVAELTRLSAEGSPSLRLHAAIELVRLYDGERRVAEALEVLDRTWESLTDSKVPPLLAQRLDLLERSLRPGQGGSGHFLSITAGERSVLYLLADRELGQVEISARLGLSINTIKSHLRSIYQKFGVTGRVEAVAYAADRGLLVTVLPWGRPAEGPPSHPV